MNARYARRCSVLAVVWLGLGLGCNADDNSVGATASSTDAGGLLDFVPDEDCVQLIWSCESDERVCIPSRNACALCAPLGEDPQDYAGHCCSGLVQNTERNRCIERPETDACIPDGGISGHTGVVQVCCEGTSFDPDTDLCEPE